MKKNLFVLLLLLPTCWISAQSVIENPNVAEQTHQELKILKISIYNDSTIIDLAIENKLASGGWFCTDRNTYIEDPKSQSRYKLVKTRGIPNCPSVYNFTQAGEILTFTLVFPPTPSITNLMNLIEDCDKACFSFKGIILDKDLNDDINTYSLGVEHYAANRTSEAINCFMKVVEDIPEFPTHVYGYSYYNLIRIYKEKGDLVTMRFWLDQLSRSPLPDRQYFLDALKKEGIPSK